MAWYICGTCGSRLVSQKVYKVPDYKRTGTKEWIKDHVLFITTVRRYVCPNKCKFTTIKKV